MRKRLILLLTLCTLLTLLRCLPIDAVSTLAMGAGRLVWIDLASMSLTLYENGEKLGRWPVAVGASDTPTPLGVFHITRRFTTEPSGFGTRFLGLDVPWGQYGIHGTNKPGTIGSRASHGCIRMFTKDVEALYRLVPNGTKVVIEDGPYGELGRQLRRLVPGSRETQVLVAQRRLQALGYYTGALDGIFGGGLAGAVKRFRADHGLSAEELIDAAAWEAMGVFLFE